MAIATTNSSSGSEFRSIVIASLAFSSFLAWATVIRIASNLGYLIGTLDYVNNATVSAKKFDIEVGVGVEESSGSDPVVKMPGHSTNTKEGEGATKHKRIMIIYSRLSREIKNNMW